MKIRFVIKCFLILLIAIMSAAFLPIVEKTKAADFSLNGPSLELRTIQFCSGCGQALRVGHLHEGEHFRCPKCGKVQTRLPKRLLKKVVLQVCQACQKAFDVNNCLPNADVKCPLCGEAQKVLPDATLTMIDKHIREKAVTALLAPKAVPGDTSVPSIKQKPATAIALPIATQTPKPATDGQQTADRNHTAPEDVAAEIPSYAPLEKLPYSRKREIQSHEKLAATVNGSPISVADVNERFTFALELAKMRMGNQASTPAGMRKIAENIPKIRSQCLDELIHETLVLQQAETEKVYISDQEMKLALHSEMQALGLAAPSPELHARVLRQLTLQKILSGKARSVQPPAPSDIQEYYRKHSGRYTVPLKVRVRLLVVYRERSFRKDTRAAEDILAEAIEYYRRSNSFSRTAQKYSEGVFASRGGMFLLEGLSLVPVSVFASPVRKELTAAKEGQVMGPVDLGYAIAIFRLEKKEGGKAPALEEVQSAVIMDMQKGAMAGKVEEYLSTLREQANIHVFD